MEKKKFSIVYLSFFLSVTVTQACTTFYSDAGNVQFCVTNNETQKSNDAACPFCGQSDCDKDWTEMFEDEQDNHDEV